MNGKSQRFWVAKAGKCWFCVGKRYTPLAQSVERWTYNPLMSVRIAHGVPTCSSADYHVDGKYASHHSTETAKAERRTRAESCDINMGQYSVIGITPDCKFGA